MSASGYARFGYGHARIVENNPLSTVRERRRAYVLKKRSVRLLHANLRGISRQDWRCQFMAGVALGRFMKDVYP